MGDAELQAKSSLLSCTLLMTQAATLGVQFAALVACGTQPTVFVFGSAMLYATPSMCILQPWDSLLEHHTAIRAPVSWLAQCQPVSMRFASCDVGAALPAPAQLCPCWMSRAGGASELSWLCIWDSLCAAESACF